jgi:hypothetical protein
MCSWVLQLTSLAIRSPTSRVPMTILPAARLLIWPHHYAGQRVGHRHHHAIAAYFEVAKRALARIAQGGLSDGTAGAGQAHLDRGGAARPMPLFPSRRCTNERAGQKVG